MAQDRVAQDRVALAIMRLDTDAVGRLTTEGRGHIDTALHRQDLGDLATVGPIE